MSGLVRSPDLQGPEKNQEICDWTLVMCCASYDALGPYNHQVPAVNAAQVGSEFFRVLVQIQNAKIAAEEAAWMQRMKLFCRKSVQSKGQMSCLQVRLGLLWQACRTSASTCVNGPNSLTGC